MPPFVPHPIKQHDLILSSSPCIPDLRPAGEMRYTEINGYIVDLQNCASASTFLCVDNTAHQFGFGFQGRCKNSGCCRGTHAENYLKKFPRFQLRRSTYVFERHFVSCRTFAYQQSLPVHTKHTLNFSVPMCRSSNSDQCCFFLLTFAFVAPPPRCAATASESASSRPTK